MVKKNYYTILEIKHNASADEIKRAYRRLAFESHPDRNPENEEAEERFKDISEAYAVLSDPAKRDEYDGRFVSRQYTRQYRHEDYHQWTSAADFFEKFFLTRGVCGGFRFRSMQAGYGNRYRQESHSEWTGRHPVFDLHISECEAAAGTDQEVLLRQGWRTARVVIQIPPQVHDGMIFRVTIGGQAGFTGDLYVRIRIV